PSSVCVTKTENDNSITLNLTVAPDDMGKVIGRNGRIAKAIRVLIKAASVTGSKKVNVDIG
ncbi:MAG: KH domain-containing protein, partial [Clostridia bacterium]|nr:KH domain-containing protein [Clostridia bacterium]